MENKITRLELTADSTFIKVFGRSGAGENERGIICDYTGSGIELCGALGGRVSIFLSTKRIDMQRGSEKIYFSVWLDGEKIPERFFAGAEESGAELVLFDKLAYGEHRIRIARQTEAKLVLCELEAICFSGTLAEAPDRRHRYIEFIGDSLTSGYGNLGARDDAEPSSAAVQDGTQGYAFLTAEALDADYSIVSESGIGLSGGFGYNKMDDTFFAEFFWRDNYKQFDFSDARVPDLVVINLGTNDFYLSGREGRSEDTDASGERLYTPAQVERAAYALIQRVRQSYGADMPIVWASRFVYIGSSHVEAIERAIARLGGEACGIYRVDLTQNAQGANGHPIAAGHVRAAEELCEFIRSHRLLG